MDGGFWVNLLSKYMFLVPLSPTWTAHVQESLRNQFSNSSHVHERKQINNNVKAMVDRGTQTFLFPFLISLDRNLNNVE